MKLVKRILSIMDNKLFFLWQLGSVVGCSAGAAIYILATDQPMFDKAIMF